MTDKEKIRNIIELFIAWNGETECIDIANLDSAVEFINSSLQEELVSEDLKNAADNALEGLLDKYDLVGTGSCLEMFKLGAEWQKKKDAELPKIWPRDTIEEYAYQVAYDLSNNWVRDYPEWKDIETACKLGAEWMRKQMMTNATEVTVHIEAGNYPYIPQMELYDYDNDVPLAKEGDKYKVVLIKENKDGNSRKEFI